MGRLSPQDFLDLPKLLIHIVKDRYEKNNREGELS